MALEMNVNGPDDPLQLDRVSLDTNLNPGMPAYGEVLAGVLDGDPLLSVRGDTAEECWRHGSIRSSRSGGRDRCRWSHTQPVPMAPRTRS